jgi:hypothetical protein
MRNMYWYFTGKVYEAEDDRGRKVAIKRVEKATNVISREVDILKLVSYISPLYLFSSCDKEREMKNKGRDE